MSLPCGFCNVFLKNPPKLAIVIKKGELPWLFPGNPSFPMRNRGFLPPPYDGFGFFWKLKIIDLIKIVKKFIQIKIFFRNGARLRTMPNILNGYLRGMVCLGAEKQLTQDAICFELCGCSYL